MKLNGGLFGVERQYQGESGTMEGDEDQIRANIYTCGNIIKPYVEKEWGEGAFLHNS
jgi:hypothetical protein